MDSFIREQILSIVTGVILSLAVVSGAFLAMSFSDELLATNFYVGTLIVGLVPLVVFCTAYFYQVRVISPMRQMFVLAPTKMTKFQEIVVKSAKDSYSVSKWMPIMITVVAALMSVTYVPSTIGPEVFGGAGAAKQIIASIVLSGNFMLFLKMTNQISAAKKSMA